jgi:Arc/MetJ family transcription regulator
MRSPTFLVPFDSFYGHHQRRYRTADDCVANQPFAIASASDAFASGDDAGVGCAEPEVPNVAAGAAAQPNVAAGAAPVIFKGVLDGRPYPDHGLSHRQWAQIPPRQIRLDELVMTTTVLALDRLLSEDSTFYGDLFPHAVKWNGDVYLEDGLHRAVRSALRNRIVLHARVFDMDVPMSEQVSI